MPLKFLIRTSDMSYPIIQGQYHRGERTHHAPTSLLQHRYFTIQVNNDNSSSSSISMNDSGDSNEFYGCCDFEHTRIILVREMNFVHYCSDWDLYLAVPQQPTTTTTTTNHNNQQSFHLLQLILVPYALHRNECQEFTAWKHIGTCRASAIRLDVESYVLQHLKSLSHNQQQQLNPQRYTYPVEHTTFQVTDTYRIETATTSSAYHWHIDLYMDSLVDESYASASMSTYLTPSSSSSSSLLVRSPNRPNAASIDASQKAEFAFTCDKENDISSQNEAVDHCTTATVDTSLTMQKHKKTRRKKPYRR